MNDHPTNTTFRYTYTAKEQEELRRIRSKYIPPEESKLDQLRRLDAQVHQKASLPAIIAGIIGSLILGTGMSCCIVWRGKVFIAGIIIGLIGLAAISLTCPLYNHALKKERERAAPDILRLTEELIK